VEIKRPESAGQAAAKAFLGHPFSISQRLPFRILQRDVSVLASRHVLCFREPRFAIGNKKVEAGSSRLIGMLERPSWVKKEPACAGGAAREMACWVGGDGDQLNGLG
jgi:hypothetical protein